MRVEIEELAQLWMTVDPAAAHHREQQQGDAEHRRFEHATWPNIAHVHADEQRDRNGREHRRRAPGAVAHGIDDDQAEHGDQDHHDDQRAEHRRVTADRPELVARHLSEAATVATGRQEQHRHVLHAAAEHGADENPQRARQIAELRGQRGTDQRTRAGNGGEVMAEHHPAIGRHEVAAVVEPHRWRGACGSSTSTVAATHAL